VISVKKVSVFFLLICRPITSKQSYEAPRPIYGAPQPSSGAPQSGVNFINLLQADFTEKSAKKDRPLDCLFALLGSAHIKAAQRTLMKLSPGYGDPPKPSYGAPQSSYEPPASEVDDTNFTILV